MNTHYGKMTTEAADRVAEALRMYLPLATDPAMDKYRHSILGDFALVRNWAEAHHREEVRQHVTNLAHALALAESDPVFAAHLQPYFRQIFAKLTEAK
jgi:hypothetical protein